MPRYPCRKTGKKNIYPSVTEIISDCTDKGGALTQWAANMTVQWIRENNEYEPYADKKGEYVGNYYYISEQGLNNARFHFREVSQKALDIGSQVHDMIELYFKKGKIIHGDTDEANAAFTAFLEWEDENNIKPIAIEQTVYNDEEEPCPDCNGEEGFEDCKLCGGTGYIYKGWAGTLDFYGYFNDKLYVIDWKSSKAHYPEMRYQVAAYRFAMNEEILIDCMEEAKKSPNPMDHLKRLSDINLTKGCGVLRLDKETGLPDFKDHSKTYKQDLKVFNCMVDLYFERHPRIRAKFLKNKEAK